ncbi:hypothetical protein AVEN_145466-1 [Araneus ventricosus]|uniref:Uncharacterized protein n=1 Tax=Araneus ventricosus TaxID=182803 RepID=A0A4Y2U553_ARAVE|nr:hypothetical protein AVEN_275310-1 [Araneus ventricosus]GBO08139.1 hypothetical protein AVEN_145466-1 [Araneus ventricosus]
MKAIRSFFRCSVVLLRNTKRTTINRTISLYSMCRLTSFYGPGTTEDDVLHSYQSELASELLLYNRFLILVEFCRHLGFGHLLFAHRILFNIRRSFALCLDYRPQLFVTQLIFLCILYTVKIFELHVEKPPKYSL